MLNLLIIQPPLKFSFNKKIITFVKNVKKDQIVRFHKLVYFARRNSQSIIYLMVHLKCTLES